MRNPALLNSNLGSKGYQAITKIGEADLDTGIEFGILKLSPNQLFEETSPLESVWVLFSGKIDVTFDGGSWNAERSSLFDEGPSALHLSKGKKIKIQTGNTPVELAVAKTKNDRTFKARYFLQKISQQNFAARD